MPPSVEVESLLESASMEDDENVAWVEYFQQLEVLNNDFKNRSTYQGGLEFLRDRAEIAVQSLNLIAVDVIESRHLILEVARQFEIFFQILMRQIRGQSSQSRGQLAVFQLGNQAEKRGVGRPKLVIEEETLVSFRNLGFSWNEIVSMLLVSRWTLHCRVKELGIEGVTGYSNISDDELDHHVIECRRMHGTHTGRSIVTGYLKSKGLRIQQLRIAASLVRVDPEGSRIRWACLVRRRKYSVPGPNSLWHIDGHHSLINWGFVIHGAIDGFSRMIVFLKCSTNNKKETVHSLFMESIDTFGIPSRVRTDHGGENVLVWDEMMRLRGPNRGSFLAGSSTHNQRIERLWRDVWMYICHEFYYLFQAMEVKGQNYFLLPKIYNSS